MSNIISSIISFFICKLSDYVEFFELIIHDVTDKSKYLLNMLKFKKYLCIKFLKSLTSNNNKLIRRPMTILQKCHRLLIVL